MVIGPIRIMRQRVKPGGTPPMALPRTPYILPSPPRPADSEAAITLLYIHNSFIFSGGVNSLSIGIHITLIDQPQSFNREQRVDLID